MKENNNKPLGQKRFHKNRGDRRKGNRYFMSDWVQLPGTETPAQQPALTREEGEIK